MKNIATSLKKKFVSKYLVKDNVQNRVKSTDINILLNRIEVNKKNETRKKLYFSAAASTGIVLFGLLIF